MTYTDVDGIFPVMMRIRASWEFRRLLDDNGGRTAAISPTFESYTPGGTSFFYELRFDPLRAAGQVEAVLLGTRESEDKTNYDGSTVVEIRRFTDTSPVLGQAIRDIGGPYTYIIG